MLRGHYRVGPAANARAGDADRDRPARRRPARNLGADPGARPGAGGGGARRRPRRGAGDALSDPCRRRLRPQARDARGRAGGDAGDADQAPGPAGLVAARGERAGYVSARRRGRRCWRGSTRAGSCSAGRRGSRRRTPAPSSSERLRGGRTAMAAIADPTAGAVPPYAIPAVSRRLSAGGDRHPGRRLALGGAQLHRLLHRELHGRAGADRRASSRSPSGCRCSATIRGWRAA